MAWATGESLTDAITHALEDRLARLHGSRTEALLVDQILDISRRCAALPELDTRGAWRSFDKGRHPAGLNIGDCCSYALSRLTGEPLLFKGKDLAGTAAHRLAPT